MRNAKSLGLPPHSSLGFHIALLALIRRKMLERDIRGTQKWKQKETQVPRFKHTML